MALLTCMYHITLILWKENKGNFILEPYSIELASLLPYRLIQLIYSVYITYLMVAMTIKYHKTLKIPIPYMVLYCEIVNTVLVIVILNSILFFLTDSLTYILVVTDCVKYLLNLET